MREFKFRAWDYTHRKMNFDVLPLGRLVGTLSPVDDPLGYINVGLYKEPNHSDTMQYTGLKDRNGKEIYEGDVVLYVTDEVVENISGYDRTDPEGHIGKVEFSNGAFWVNGNGEFYSYGEQNFSWSELEVIGNIYENPELLNAH